MRRTLSVAGAVVLATAAATTATPALAAGAAEATVSVLHAVPGLTVDVYANGDELIPDFEPGTLTDPLTLPAGTYDLQVFADGEGPAGTPAIEASGVEVPAGVNATIVAHLTEAGEPVLTVFVNDVDPVAAGEARLTVRHTAAAPAVDIRAGGTPIFTAVTNPNEGVVEVAAGTVSADVVLAGTDTVAIGPADLALGEGTNTIVYAWGSAEDDNLALAAQTITGLHSTPEGVPGGQAGLVDDGTGSVVTAGLALVGLALVGGLGVVAARRRSLAEARR